MQARTAVSILVLAFGTGVVLAHDYDPNKPMTLSGVVKEITWGTPYVKIHLSVQDFNGKPKDWELETARPSVLESNGIVRTSIKKGDRITAQGEQEKNGSEHVLVKSITLADGRGVSIGAAEAAIPSSSKLPKTASHAPLISLIGLIALGGGLSVTLLRRRLS
jgi:LPXTG-motif cell wall-anchored protein